MLSEGRKPLRCLLPNINFILDLLIEFAIGSPADFDKEQDIFSRYINQGCLLAPYTNSILNLPGKMHKGVQRLQYDKRNFLTNFRGKILKTQFDSRWMESPGSQAESDPDSGQWRRSVDDVERRANVNLVYIHWNCWYPFFIYQYCRAQVIKIPISA